MPPRRDETEAAEHLATLGLTFLAADGERLGGFLALTGLDPREIRAIAGTPGFLTAVLDHILSDEALLLDFARDHGLAPAAVGRARSRLAGPVPDGLRDG